MKLRRFDFTDLARSTGIDVERLKHAARMLVPERGWLLQSDTGEPTEDIDELDAIFSVAAFHLCVSGCAEDAIPNLLNLICRVPKPGRNPLRLPLAADVSTNTNAAVVQVADGSHVRWRVGAINTPWTRVVGPRRKAEPDYAPRVIVAVDLGAIRDQIRGA